ncbi:MAG TPA: nuclear transport factor 2 family protein [Gemmatimonadales bacterium]|nr:nuclear transport factor 2 family protein [Gemmatimonadales bacterium]
MIAANDNLSLIRGILDRMLDSGDIRYLVNRLADDVVFSAPGEAGHGRTAVADYFDAIGPVATFWRVRYAWSGTRVAALVEERFTVVPGAISADSRFTLLFDVHGGVITRLRVVDEQPSAPYLGV